MNTSHHMSQGVARGAASVLLCTAMACQDITAKLPAGTVDPSTYNTPEAAEEMARNARYEFQYALFDFMVDAGRISDELTFTSSDFQQMVPGVFTANIVLDQRYLPDEAIRNTSAAGLISQIKSYAQLQHVRSVASLAQRALVTYAPNAPAVLRGELFAYEAFAGVMLADLYCSGIPLSTVDFQGDYTYVPGSTTQRVYEHALELFDSALVLSANDAAVQSLARIGKGRALLALGRYSDASAVVTDVAAAFRFDLPVVRINSRAATNPSGNPWDNSNERSQMTVANLKGIVGLPFVTPRDPRVPLDSVNPTTPDRFPRRRERLVVVNGIEAELIRAEALLQAGNADWLTALNTLRTTCPSAVGCATPAPSGTGGIAGLPPLTDPGSDTARVSLLFRERAYWLFFTGHRQGDLRRLIRHYGRTIEDVYPRGAHPGGDGAFDRYVDVPMPVGERFNPHFAGCFSRGA